MALALRSVDDSPGSLLCDVLDGEKRVGTLWLVRNESGEAEMSFDLIQGHRSLAPSLVQLGRAIARVELDALTIVAETADSGFISAFTETGFKIIDRDASPTRLRFSYGAGR